MVKDHLKIIKGFRKAYKNYLRVLLDLYFKREQSKEEEIIVNVILRNGTSLKVPYGQASAYARLMGQQNSNISNLALTERGISFLYKNHSVIIDPSRFSDPYAVFFLEEYAFLNVNGKDVIDIGMNIGDSLIYFILNGAKRVIGLEPYPYAFKFAEKNVQLNSVKNAILLNAGYGKDSKILVDDNRISTNSSDLVASNSGKEIPIYSLKTLVNMYEIKKAVLKMDCEGCEYNLLNEDNDTLDRFDMIQIEYHYGYEKLEEKLKLAGFSTKHTEPREAFNPEASNPNMLTGYIYAIRR